MPRDYDDDRPRRRGYDDDDRPRRRDRRPPPPPSSGTGTVLLIVGLVVGVPMVLGVIGLVCVGAFGFMAARAPMGNMNASMASIEVEITAEEFLGELQSGDSTGAYLSTSSRYRAGTTQMQFDRLVKASPVLTTTHTADQIGTTSVVGAAPNRTATLTYNVVPFAGGPASPRAVTCTVKVAEQPDGTWQVDGFSVP
jgi:hypothetical protein